ncbi:unnamed protein product [Coffea canephora]|uniref:Uncharacterized protein n=1 Tax=Coffea canephora TaxID=49390 RepID=A0A068TQP0_COFCA|nr:unnamed protein product [Coffea canephora]
MRDVVSMLQEAKPKRKLPGGGVTGSGEENGTACDAVPLVQKPASIIEC